MNDTSPNRAPLQNGLINHDQFTNPPTRPNNIPPQHRTPPVPTQKPTSTLRGVANVAGVVGPAVQGVASGFGAYNGIQNWHQSDHYQRTQTALDTANTGIWLTIAGAEAAALAGSAVASRMAGRAWSLLGFTSGIASGAQFGKGIYDITQGQGFSATTNIIGGVGGLVAGGLAVKGKVGAATAIGTAAAALPAAAGIANAVQNNKTQWGANNASVVGTIEKQVFDEAVKATGKDQKTTFESVANEYEQRLPFTFDSVWNNSHQADFLANQNNNTRFVPPRYHEAVLGSHPQADRFGGHRPVGSEDSS
ncbi:hypothetical protein CS022_07760 [Veronia nyctiphanis]|uniref:Uncharacterized protein n=1 Tax=Veronia nyctiphanis TaxID=1278244 RepID=A0A4Q0YR44_9GAMM|nr:hypothetical protein [Veronia nyctiphanis]RXJ73640.1 hypothetical protein CS022_07760 [Veronia nyctiphanis]